MKSPREIITWLSAIKTDIYLNRIDDKDSKIEALTGAIDLLEYFKQDIEIS